MKRQTCGACLSGDLVEVLDLGTSPLADEFPPMPEIALALPRYPIGLARCVPCGLVQLTEIVPDDELWGGDYGFYTGASSVASEQQRDYAHDLMNRFPRLARKLTVEIACNDGTMLQHFAAAGYPTLGVDPASGPAQIARDRGLDIIEAGFGRRVAEQIVADRGHAGLIVANNVVAHVADLDDFMAGVRLLLAHDGVAVFEFQYLADLVTGNQIDHVYHEHRQFFSLDSFSRAAAEHDLAALSVRQTSPQGGSLRVTVGNPMLHADHSVGNLLRDEAWLRAPHSLDGMQGRADRIRSRLRDMLWAQKSAKARVAGYGASAKSTTLLNFCDLGPDLIQYIVDTTPTKHGRYTPGTAIPIISPTADSRSPDVYVLFVWNYAAEVMRREKIFAAHGGRWLVPIPVPVMI